MPKPSGEKTRKDLVIIGKVLFSSDLLFSKDYILLLKITLKWLLITQGKYVPLLIHLLACNAFVNSLEKYWRHSFRKSLWKYCEKWLPRPFRPWLILTTIFFFPDVDSSVSYSEVCHSNLSNTQSKTYIISTKVY